MIRSSPIYIKTAIALVLALQAMVNSADAFEGGDALQLTGYAAVEGRFFTGPPALEDQHDGPQISLAFQPELGLDLAAGRHQFKLTPFARVDGMDNERTHADLREAYWRYNADSWEVLAGINRVFWGVAESRHLVDIINQSDLLEDVDQEDKLGQPMLMTAGQQNWGEVQLYLLPYFRERRYPGESGRLRPPLPVDEEGRFESDAARNNIDGALRYAHYFGDWDVGGYYFYGTSREPRLMPNERMDRLIARYDIIRQVGVDLQYTREAWLWKFEGIVRDGRQESFGAAVGGFEWTLYQVLKSNADLGMLLEYNWDGRDNSKSPPTFYDNDIFAGMRLALNDSQDTTALMGTLVDMETGSKFISLEAERRLTASFVLELQARLFVDLDAQESVKSIEDDDFMNISLKYYY